MMKIRPFKVNDASTILSWCKDKHAFRLWSADRYKEFPAQPEEMMEQYEGDNMYPLTAIADDEIVGHILLRFPSEDKSLIRFGFVIVDDSKRGKGYGKQLLRQLPLACFATTTPPSNATSLSVSASQAKMPIRLTEKNGKNLKWN